MDNSLRSGRLIRRVVNRLHLDAVIGSFLHWMLICSGVYGVLLLASRLLGLIPDIFNLQSLIGIPVSAFVLCLLFHRRPTTRDAARRIDGHQGTKDLFLTLTLLKSSKADFRPLVVRDAEVTAPSVKPGEVVPFRCANRLMKAGMTLLILWGCLHLKQFDPFGRVEAADQITKQKQELVQSKKATKIRSAQLKKNLGEDRQAEDVKKALNALKTSFRKMKPREKKENFRVLAERQKNLGEKWRKLSEKKLNQLLK
ncbi:MAG: hypothetical protein IH899_21350, partial [Planctomycetes bacterium]|nr:hypothetical protein [Planctomycetota bacterium]